MGSESLAWFLCLYLGFASPSLCLSFPAYKEKLWTANLSALWKETCRPMQRKNFLHSRPGDGVGFANHRGWNLHRSQVASQQVPADVLSQKGAGGRAGGSRKGAWAPCPSSWLRTPRASRQTKAAPCTPSGASGINPAVEKATHPSHYPCGLLPLNRSSPPSGDCLDWRRDT